VFPLCSDASQGIDVSPPKQAHATYGRDERQPAVSGKDAHHVYRNTEDAPGVSCSHQVVRPVDFLQAHIQGSWSAESRNLN
jgi:hypothetical protein